MLEIHSFQIAKGVAALIRDIAVTEQPRFLPVGSATQVGKAAMDVDVDNLVAVCFFVQKYVRIRECGKNRNDGSSRALVS